jgi:predicted signal transduction protein with EAL and GGDEF domain
VLAGETVHFDKHYPQRADDAHLAISFMPLRLEQGQVDGYVMVAQDITRHKHEAVRLLELSQRDALTGLLNRAGFDATVSDWQDSADEDVALLYIDLDRFKTVKRPARPRRGRRGAAPVRPAPAQPGAAHRRRGAHRR